MSPAWQWILHDPLYTIHSALLVVRCYKLGQVGNQINPDINCPGTKLDFAKEFAKRGSQKGQKKVGEQSQMKLSRLCSLVNSEGLVKAVAWLPNDSQRHSLEADKRFLGMNFLERHGPNRDNSIILQQIKIYCWSWPHSDKPYKSMVPRLIVMVSSQRVSCWDKNGDKLWKLSFDVYLNSGFVKTDTEIDKSWEICRFQNLT